MILDRDVLRPRSHLRRKHECNRPLIVFINCDWLTEMTSQHHRDVSLNLDYKTNLLNKNHKR